MSLRKICLSSKNTDRENRLNSRFSFPSFTIRNSWKLFMSFWQRPLSESVQSILHARGTRIGRFYLLHSDFRKRPSVFPLRLILMRIWPRTQWTVSRLLPNQFGFQKIQWDLHLSLPLAKKRIENCTNFFNMFSPICLELMVSKFYVLKYIFLNKYLSLFKKRPNKT